jgi:hypothetical protein
VTEKRRSYGLFLGLIGVTVSVAFQVVAALLETSPESDTLTFWAMCAAFVVIYPSGLFIAEGYLNRTIQPHTRIGPLLVVLSLVAIVFLAVYFNALRSALFPRVGVPNLLILDSIAVLEIGVLFQLMTRKHKLQVGNITNPK